MVWLKGVEVFEGGSGDRMQLYRARRTLTVALEPKAHKVWEERGGKTWLRIE